MRAYNIFTQTYVTSQQVEVVKNCNGYMATNTGADIVFVNGQILYPGTPGTIQGDSRSIGGNEGEIFIGRIDIAFAAVTAPRVEIVQKFYEKDVKL